ncbi:MAG: alpha/beta fold hydrolase [Bacteroidetes bacterium]|jgi:dipeptidyl-peptidase-4|nr:alpha/beta fold hydrolase [Bacteroidota bacterium]
MKDFLVLTLLFISTITYGSEKFTLEDIFDRYLFAPEQVQQFNSYKNGKQYTVLENQRKIVAYDFKNGKLQDVVFSIDQSGMNINNIYDYQFNDSENMLLISTNIAKQYRYSYFASYYVVNLRNNQVTALNKEPVQLATWSGDGQKIAYVKQNNLYYYDLKSDKHIEVTNDGAQNVIINGAADWVYEEEFALKTGFKWSPNSDQIAFYKFNEQGVNEYTLTYYGKLYPDLYTYKYPKAGEQNAIVNIMIYDLKTGDTRSIDIGKETDQYIPRIKWTPDGENLCIIRLNRLQNQVDVLLANPNTGSTKQLYSERNDQYIKEINDEYITFLENKNEFIIQSEDDGFLHLYRYNMDGQYINQITKGEWDLFDFYGIHEEKNQIFYRSNEESTVERHIYSINLDGSDKKLLTNGNGVHHATFSSNFRYFVHELSSTHEPLRVSLKNATGEEIRLLEDNKELKNLLDRLNYQPKEFLQVPTENDLQLNGYMIKPPDFDSTKQYPVLMYVYGGPESQVATNRYSWSKDTWFNLLSEHGYIVACFDNRGTDGRGEAFRKSTYLQLGKLETIDQINAARYMGNLSYVDADRIGIYGSSYGGYLSSLCVLKGADIFSMAIAVAPVTNWRFYDTIYTERFMRTPQENGDGYDNNSPINFTHLLEDPYLLIHGMGDDNVHLQNSTELTEQLVRNGKQFDQFFYPNRSHSISGNNALLHLYHKMTDFILQNL